jgi:hypothetical protein
LLALVDDLSSGIVARDTVGNHWPGIAAIGNVRVTVVKGDGVDFDEDLCGG